MKKILFILLCLPIIGFGQKDLSKLLFQLIDADNPRVMLENNDWITTSMNNYTDASDISYNQFKFSKRIKFRNNSEKVCYLTVNEYPGYSNEISFKLYNKEFFNHFQKIIKKSSYKLESKNIENNVIETTHKKSPLQVKFEESLNNYYMIKLFNYKDKKIREDEYFRTNATITSDKVNLRSAPSIDSQILGQVNSDDQVWIEEIKNIYTDDQFIVDRPTQLYTSSTSYPLNSGKMVTKINSPIYYNGEYRRSDSYWVTVSVNMDNKNFSGLIQKSDISLAVAQKWFKINTPTLSGWVYGKFIEQEAY